MAQWFVKDFIRYNPTTNGYNQPLDYRLTASATTVNEGAACTITARTWGLNEGTALTWAIANVQNIDMERFSDTSGTVYTNSSGTATFNITVLADLFTTEDTQTYDVELYYYTLGNPVDVLTITVSDTSKTPPGLPIDWYGTTSYIIPTGTYSQVGDAIILQPGAFVDVGHSLQSTSFTMTIDADLGWSWNGSTWDVIWAQEAYSGDGSGNVGLFCYWNGAGFTYGKPGFECGGDLPENEIVYMGRSLYTFVMNGATQKLYVNGDPIANSGQPGSDSTFPANTLLIGSRHDGNGTGSQVDCNGGTYYRVTVDSTVLTDQQVLDYYNNWDASPKKNTILNIDFSTPWAYDGSSTTLYDTSGNYSDGQAMGNWNNTIQVVDNHLEIQSYGGNYVMLPPNFIAWSNNEAFTLHFWISIPTDALGVILGQTSDQDPIDTGGWVPAVYVDEAGKLNVSTFWHGDTYLSSLSTSNTAVDDGLYHLITITYKAGTQAIYIDGVPDGIWRTGLTQAWYANNYYYWLASGKSQGWPGDPNNSSLSCNIGQFKAHDYAQNATDILAFYNLTKNNFPNL